jgi:hypothetical protein
MNRLKRERLLWGAVFIGASIHAEDNAPILLSDGWLDTWPKPQYDGEPTRALVFMTRVQARAWCASQQAKYRKRSDCYAKWRFRPVRVRETVEVVDHR